MTKEEVIVVKCKMAFKKEDFEKWAEDIKKQGENIIVIPYDAECVSAVPIQGLPSDLINRADTLAKIKEYCIDGDSVVQKWFDTMGIEEVINTMPSVSAERVGEWKYDYDKDDHYCTRCHKYAGDWEMNLLSDYCPSCGARMENKK